MAQATWLEPLGILFLVLLALIILAIIIFAIAMLPDFRRYLRIRKM